MKRTSAPEGMTTMRIKSSIAGLALALAFLSGTAQAQNRALAGEVALVTGIATASAADGNIRKLAKGDPLYAGEIISAGANTYVNLKFSDGGLILLRPKTRFEIEDFSYSAPAAAEPAPAAAAATTAPASAAVVPSAAAASAPQGGTSRAFFRLLKGSFRAVSGVIGKASQADYRVATPVATIGIRGTDYFAELIDASFARDPVLRASLPPGVSSEGGLYVQQFDGTTEVTSSSGLKTFVGKGQTLVTLKDGSQISLPKPAQKIALNPPGDPQSCD